MCVPPSQGKPYRWPLIFPYLCQALDDYIPHLVAIIDCLKVDDLLHNADPGRIYTSLRNARLLSLSVMTVFSWRPTLTSSITSSRLNLPSFMSELHFTLLTYVFALSNLASSIALSTGTGGSYELSNTLSSTERKAKDESIGQAADLLCRAVGILDWIGLNLLSDFEKETRVGKGKKTMVEGQRNALSGIAKLVRESRFDIALD